MPKRTSTRANLPQQQSEKLSIANLFARKNRGLLLDVFVFVLNIFLMRFLTRQFINIFAEASADDPIAKLALGLTLLAMWILPPASRYEALALSSTHLKAQGTSIEKEETKLAGCLFNPIFYFCLNLVITSALLASFGEFFLGKNSDSGPVFIPLVIAGLILTVFQTYLIYRFFIPPKKPPQSPFLLSQPKAKLSATSACS